MPERTTQNAQTLLSPRVPRDTEHERYHPELEEELKECLFCLRRNVVHGKIGRWSVVLVLAGAVGNCIDRILSGYVVDMFDLTLFSYPVFNFADCCVVVGAILGAVYYLFLYDKYDKKDRKHGNDPADGDN